MTTNAATVTGTAAPFSRNGLHPQRIPLLLGALVAMIGAAIAIFAVKADWMFLGDGYRFALRQTHVAMACGGLALFAGGVTVMLPGAWRRLGEWLLLVVAALAGIAAGDGSIHLRAA